VVDVVRQAPLSAAGTGVPNADCCSQAVAPIPGGRPSGLGTDLSPYAKSTSLREAAEIASPEP
jgi:hypothetical protein